MPADKEAAPESKKDTKGKAKKTPPRPSKEGLARMLGESAKEGIKTAEARKAPERPTKKKLAEMLEESAKKGIELVEEVKEAPEVGRLRKKAASLRKKIENIRDPREKEAFSKELEDFKEAIEVEGLAKELIKILFGSLDGLENRVDSTLERQKKVNWLIEEEEFNELFRELPRGKKQDKQTVKEIRQEIESLRRFSPLDLELHAERISLMERIRKIENEDLRNELYQRLRKKIFSEFEEYETKKSVARQLKEEEWKTTLKTEVVKGGGVTWEMLFGADEQTIETIQEALKLSDIEAMRRKLGEIPRAPLWEAIEKQDHQVLMRIFARAGITPEMIREFGEILEAGEEKEEGLDRMREFFQRRFGAPRYEERGRLALYLSDRDIADLRENPYEFFRRVLLLAESRSPERTTYFQILSMAYADLVETHYHKTGYFEIPEKLSDDEKEKMWREKNRAFQKVSDMFRARFNFIPTFMAGGVEQNPEDRMKSLPYFLNVDLAWFHKQWWFKLAQLELVEHKDLVMELMRIGERREEFLENYWKKTQERANKWLEMWIKGEAEASDEALSYLFGKEIEDWESLSREERIEEVKKLTGEFGSEKFGVRREEAELAYRVLRWEGRLAVFDARLKDKYWYELFPYFTKEQRESFRRVAAGGGSPLEKINFNIARKTHEAFRRGEWDADLRTLMDLDFSVWRVGFYEQDTIREGWDKRFQFRDMLSSSWEGIIKEKGRREGWSGDRIEEEKRRLKDLLLPKGIEDDTFINPMGGEYWPLPADFKQLYVDEPIFDESGRQIGAGKRLLYKFERDEYQEKIMEQFKNSRFQEAQVRALEKLSVFEDLGMLKSTALRDWHLDAVGIRDGKKMEVKIVHDPIGVVDPEKGDFGELATMHVAEAFMGLSEEGEEKAKKKTLVGKALEKIFGIEEEPIFSDKREEHYIEALRDIMVGHPAPPEYQMIIVNRWLRGYHRDLPPDVPYWQFWKFWQKNIENWWNFERTAWYVLGPDKYIRARFGFTAPMIISLLKAFFKEAIAGTELEEAVK